MSTSLRKYIILIGDIVVLFFALWITLLIRYKESFSPELWQRHFAPFAVVFGALIVILYIEDLYSLTVSVTRADFANRLLRGMVFAGALGITFFYLGDQRLFTIKPQRVFLIVWLISLAGIYGWRFLFHRLSLSKAATRNVLLVGSSELTQEIIDTIKVNPGLGYNIHTILTPRESAISEKLKSLVKVDSFKNIEAICKEYDITTIVSAYPLKDNPDLSDSLFTCIPLHIDFMTETHFYELITGKIPVTSIEHTWFLENLTEYHHQTHDHFKRMLDILSSVILLLVAAFFIPLIILTQKITSKGPVLFTQTRTGKAGKEFKAMKFRSMIQNAEKNGPQWSSKNDPRVTSFGRFMRKTRIDEIPQLLNILKGEMSLIGPRPERPEFIEQLEQKIPFYKERLLVKPGLTGWAQVMGPAYGGSEEESLIKLQYDLYYIKNRSIGLDLSIILKTIRTVLTQKGQ